MNFDEAFTKLLGNEGGLSDNAADPGGLTRWGISRRAYPNEDIRNLTQDRARELYKRDYWDKCRADELPDEIRFDVFDAAVNSGIGQSVKWLQKAAGTNPDGILGPQTMDAVTLQGANLTARFNGYRLLFMTDLPTWSTFGKGWARRIAGNLIC
jgi:lysozyme family protein